MDRDELEKRTLEFGKNLIKVLQGLPKNLINDKLIGQAISAGTSIGANYREANASESQKDFKHKINISFKESKEARYWLDLLISTNSNFSCQLCQLRKESDEFARIFGKAVTTCRQNAEYEKNAK